jgi:dTDP-4-amino-4,6-dideoxygalactose transaminase
MSGSYTAHFEDWLAKKNNNLYAVTCHSGTQALEIIASFYRVNSGIQPPTVLIPSLTYVATANAWRRAGWRIAIIDTDAYGLMDLKKIPKDLSWQAICPVGLYGHALSEKYWGWKQAVCIEDAAQHWLSNNCHRLGTSAISFDPTKNFNSYGNGGAIVTNDRQVYDYARDWTTNHPEVERGSTGTNSRMSEIDCAQMLVKAGHIDKWQKRRADIVKHWMDRLHNTSIRSLIDSGNFSQHCYHKFVLQVEDRDKLQKDLSIRKIETKIHYKDPIQDLGAYQDCEGPNLLGASYSLSRKCLSLPIYPELTDLEVEYIIDSVLDCSS